MLKKFLALSALFALLSLHAFSQDTKVTSKDVTYKSGEDTVHAVLYVPAHKGKVPAIVVIHEWYGLNDWAKQQAQKIATHGYITLAIDLYRGKVASDKETAHELMRGLPQDRAVRDLLAAVAYLKTLPDVDVQRIADIGWCMGGSFSGELANSEPTLKASVINYGSLATDKATLAKVHAVVLGNFGANDQGIPASDIQQYAATMKSLGKSADMKIYPGVGHRFMHDDTPATADAWKRIFAFYAEQLK
jgi:carboxymethylenebutenolidase